MSGLEMRRRRPETATLIRRVTAASAAAAALVATGAYGAVHAAVEDLSWGDCPAAVTAANPDGERARCTTISVPLDYTNPAAGKIDLLVSGFLPKSGPATRVILGNPGGPGGDAYNFWGAAGRSGKWLFDDNALIAIQPRGLEFSTPLSCSTTAQCDAVIAANPNYLPNLTTENIARDMEEFRKAAGLDTVSYYGASWGTSLGAAFASMFPGSVDRLILDSNMNPKTIGVGGGALGGAAQNEAFRVRLSQYFEWAAANNDTVRLGATPLQVFEKWNTARLSASPKAYAANYLPPAAVAEDLPENLRPFAAVILPAYNTARSVYERIAYNVRLTAGLITGALTPLDVIQETRGPSSIMQNSTSKLYNRAQWTTLSAQVYGMAVQGKPDSDYPGTSAAIGASNGKVTIYDRMGPAVVDADAKAAQTGKVDLSYLPAALASAGTFLFNAATGADTAYTLSAFMRTLGNTLAFAGSNRAPDYSVKLATAPLLLQSYFDPATPYPGAAAMRDAVRGYLISVGGGDHGLFRRGEATVDNAVKQYLKDGTVSVTTAPEASLGKDGKYVIPDDRTPAPTGSPAATKVPVAASAGAQAAAGSPASSTATTSAAAATTAAPTTSGATASSSATSTATSGGTATSSGTATETPAAGAGATDSAASTPTVTEPATEKASTTEKASAGSSAASEPAASEQKATSSEQESASATKD